MESERLRRLNELAKKQKETGLTDEEMREQQFLRAEYLSEVRKNIFTQLDNTYVVGPDGKKHKLKRKTDD